MQNAIRDAQKAGLLGKDASISLRDGHMVIPVDAANKRKSKDVYMTVQGVENCIY